MAKASGDARVVPGGFVDVSCRIDALPNDVLIRAISYLDARQLVQTCVLSTRWRDLWRSVPRINASCDEFDGTADTEEACDVLFKKFINRFLMLRNPVALEEFRLRYNIPDGSYDPYGDSEDANIWICHALQSNALSVEVFGGFVALHLDPAVFASKCCHVTSIQLCVVFLEPPFFRNQQTGCPVLERLILRCCTIFDPEISSHTLKVLTMIDDCHCTFEGQASISIPSLIDLHFFPVGARIPLLNNMESLVTASVCVGTDDTQVADVCQFLRGLSGVRELEFYYRGTMLKIEKNFNWCPKFNNLTILTLQDWCLSADFYALIVFLQNSPNLRKLILEIMGNSGTHKAFIGELEERYFTCEHLKVVKIICSVDWEDGPMCNDLEKFLVGNGISSDQIKIKNWYVNNYTDATTEASDDDSGDATEASDGDFGDATEVSDGDSGDATEASDGDSGDATEASDDDSGDATEVSNGDSGDATEVSRRRGKRAVKPNMKYIGSDWVSK